MNVSAEKQEDFGENTLVELLAKIPFRTEILSSRQKKPGVKIVLPPGTHNLFALSKEGAITAKLLDKAGFALLANYRPSVEKEEGEVKTGYDVTEEGEWPRSKNNDLQGLHQDVPCHKKKSKIYLSLRNPVQRQPREADTAVGFLPEVKLHSLEFLRHHNKEELERVRESISPRVRAVFFKKQETVPLGVKLYLDKLFQPSRPYYPELVDYLIQKGVINVVQSRPDQLLLIDDSTMVHARIPHKAAPIQTDSYLLRRFLEWDEDKNQFKLH